MSGEVARSDEQVLSLLHSLKKFYDIRRPDSTEFFPVMVVLGSCLTGDNETLSKVLNGRTSKARFENFGLAFSSKGKHRKVAFLNAFEASYTQERITSFVSLLNNKQTKTFSPTPLPLPEASDTGFGIDNSESVAVQTTNTEYNSVHVQCVLPPPRGTSDAWRREKKTLLQKICRLKQALAKER